LTSEADASNPSTSYNFTLISSDAEGVDESCHCQGVLSAGVVWAMAYNTKKQDTPTIDPSFLIGVFSIRALPKELPPLSFLSLSSDIAGRILFAQQVSDCTSAN